MPPPCVGWLFAHDQDTLALNALEQRGCARFDLFGSASNITRIGLDFEFIRRLVEPFERVCRGAVAAAGRGREQRMATHRAAGVSGAHYKSSEELARRVAHAETARQPGARRCSPHRKDPT